MYTTDNNKETVTVCATCMSDVVITNRWSGHFEGTISVTFTNAVTEWTMEITFSEPVNNLDVYQAVVVSSSNDNMVYIVGNENYNGEVAQGENLALGFQASYPGSEPSTIRIQIPSQPDCCSEVEVTPPIPTAAPGEGCPTCCSTTSITSEWQGNFIGEFNIPITKRVTGGWTVEIYFTAPVNSLTLYNADMIGTLNGNKVYQIINRQHNEDFNPGEDNYQGFQATISGSTPTFHVYMVGQPQCCNNICGTPGPTTTEVPQQTDVPDPEPTDDLVSATQSTVLVGTTQEQIYTTEAHFDTTEDLVDTTEALVDTTQLYTTDALVGTTQERIHTTEAHFDTTEDLVDTTEDLVDTTEALVETTQLYTTDALVGTTQELIYTTEAHFDTTEALVDTTQIYSTEALMGTTDELMHTLEGHFDTTEDIVETTEKLADSTQGKYTSDDIVYSTEADTTEISTVSQVYTTNVNRETVTVCATCMSDVVITNRWTGHFEGTISVTFTNAVTEWTMEITFSEPVNNLDVYQAVVVSSSNDNMVYIVGNENYNGEVAQGENLALGFQASYPESEPSTIRIQMPNQPDCCSEVEVTPPIPTAAPGEGCPTCCSTTSITSEWQDNFIGEFNIPITKRVTGGWTVEIYFTAPVNSLTLYNADMIGTLNGNKVYQIINRQHNEDFNPGEDNYQGFQATISGSTPTFHVYMVGQPQCCNNICGTPGPTTTEVPQQTDVPDPEPTDDLVSATQPAVQTETPESPTTDTPDQTDAVSFEQTVVLTGTSEAIEQTDALNPHTTETPEPEQKTTTVSIPTIPANVSYAYDDVLYKSILFYEAQRSGALPENNRIPYRGDSALDDAGDDGEDLTGGWYDAGDYVKFGHPMAGAVTVLAWGLIEYKSGYEAAGELNNMYDCIKWATDYFLKCHINENEFYAQVGDGYIDHAYWGRPEDMDLYRPAFKVTKENPGSDVVGETAAALAATSIAFQDFDSVYAATLLSSAKELYVFAKTSEGKYSDTITNAAEFYRSTGYQDELCWAAAWLYMATSNVTYLTDAETIYDMHGLSSKPWAFDWDDKKAGVQVLLYKLTGDVKYKTDVETFITGWVNGNDVGYTPQGLAWRIQWSPNRYSANVAFLALVAADLGIQRDSYQTFAKQQINYMLGDTGRSYVVGFGVNPPDRPHHGSSSCPDTPASCGWDDFNYDGPNPQILYGALVGGPDINDNFENDRTDYIQNEVTCDYNAGFQSSVAGIIKLLIDESND
ncbi:uncharacterized protein [Antedon mediterranea]|uniref:uncharacterized protein n=1 Tax=Antedon mediterranea TaxID=105859 RepID=UPI003AF40DB6